MDSSRSDGPYDPEKPDSPDLGMSDIGPGHEGAERRALNKAESSGRDDNSELGGSRSSGQDELKDAEKGGFTKGKGDSGKEESEEDDGGGLYSDGKDGGPSKRSRGRMAVRILRNRKTLVGGGGGIILSLCVAFFAAISSGPLEFIHIAQLMDKFHFSNQQDAEDGRLTKIARYIHDPSKPQNTRLGIVGNAVADKLESKISDATGLHSDYNATSGRFLGYYADPEHEDFKDMSPEEMKDHISNEYGVARDSIQTTTRTINGKDVETVGFNPDTTRTVDPRGYFKQTSFARGLLGKAGLSKVSAYAGSRVLTSRAGWTFHPIKALDSTYQAKLLEGGKAALDKFKKQFNDQEKAAINSDTTKPAVSETGDEKDNKGDTVSDPAKAGAADAGKSVQGDSSDANIKGKLAGGAVSIAGVACVMKGIDDAVPKQRQTKVMQPMKKLAGQFVSLGSQTPSGQDLTTPQLGQYKQFLDGTNSSGQVTSTWNQARSIQAELGEPQTGPDIPKSAQVFNGGVPFGFIDNIPILGTVCDALGSPIGSLIGTVLSPFQTVFNQIAIGPLISDFTNWLSGTPIDIFKGAGAVDGGYIDYGSRLSANEQFASAGGTQLSSGDESDLIATTATLDNSQFQSKSLAYRLFNPDDDQTLISRLMDNHAGATTTQDFASLFHGFGNIFADALKAPSMLFSSAARAAPAYDYHGLKAVGFTASVLADPAYDNSFTNACDVTGGQGCSNATGILGDPNSPNQTYIDKIQKCFGDTITPDGGKWDVNFNSNKPLDMDSDDYKNAGCGDSDSSWTRVRLWILDTQTIEGYDCSQGGTPTADQSCQDLGFGSGSVTSSSDTGGTGTTTTGVSGNGAGKFTTNTSQAPYPGLDQMLARVKATSSSAGASAFCGSIGGCGGKCESAVEMAWLGHRGQYADPFGSAGDTPTAGSAWAAAVASGHAHPGDRNPPVGALLIYNAHNPGDPPGHITIYVGDNLVFSTDFDHQGSAGVDPASHIEVGSWANSYVGWMDPYFSGKVGD